MAIHDLAVSINGLTTGSIYALVALGFTVIYGTVRFFHFAHGAVYAVGAYLAWLAVSRLGLPFFPSVVLACLLAGALGVLIDVAVYRPLRARRAPNLVFLPTLFGIFVSQCTYSPVPIVFAVDMSTVLDGMELLHLRVSLRNVQVFWDAAKEVLPFFESLWEDENITKSAKDIVTDAKLFTEESVPQAYTDLVTYLGGES